MLCEPLHIRSDMHNTTDETYHCFDVSVSWAAAEGRWICQNRLQQARSVAGAPSCSQQQLWYEDSFCYTCCQGSVRSHIALLTVLSAVAAPSVHLEVVGRDNPFAIWTRYLRLDRPHPACISTVLDQQLCDVLPADIHTMTRTTAVRAFSQY